MMDIKEIMRTLPHRYPFLLVDRVVSMEGDKIVATKNVTINEEFFQGHFPGNPIMPGVLIVEAMAQTGGILAINGLGAGTVDVYFMSIDGVKFRKPVTPGDQLRFEIEVIQKRGKVWRMAGKTFIEDKLATEAEFTAMIVERAKA